MRVFRTTKSYLNWRLKVSARKSIGFVPTMGALHRGHLSLVQRSMKQNDLTVVSIFVNPTQFGPQEDFSKYPRPEKEDLRALKSVGVDVVFIPKSPLEIYPDTGTFQVVPPKRLSAILEGRFRPGHFEGVATVVLKLFQIIDPHRAYFGEKDYQQLQIIKSLVKDFFLKIKIVACPTRREKSGLALSSRNRYLSAEQQRSAAQLYESLRSAPSPEEASLRLQQLGFQVDYVEAWDENLTREVREGRGRWLAAARIHGVRLIDNLKR